MPVKIFFCYAHEDEALLNKLKTHLKPLQRKGLIDVWYDRDISAGTVWEQQIKEQLNIAQIILLLVSPDFMDSDYCYGIEMQRALERHELGEARVIPIILRHVYWQDVLGDLQALPTDAKPIKSWSDLDEALYNVAEGIRTVVKQLTAPPPFVSPAVPGEMKQEIATPSVRTPIAQQGGNASPSLPPLAVEKLAPLRTLRGHTAAVFSVALSADGQTLVSGSLDKTIKVWNLSTGKEIRTLTGHTDAIWSVALSADGRTLVSGSLDKTIKVWNLSTGKELRTLTGHKYDIRSVVLSADGRTLVSGSLDKTIKVWNLSTGKELRTLKGHTSGVTCVVLSADGQTLVSGSSDHTIKVWNLSIGKEIRTLIGHTDAVTSVVLSADGQTLVSGCWDATIMWWGM